MWILKWIVNLSFLANPLPHTVQAKAFTAPLKQVCIKNIYIEKLISKNIISLKCPLFFRLDVVCNCWIAFNLLEGFNEPPSMYGSVNGIKFGRGIFAGMSVALKFEIWNLKFEIWNFNEFRNSN